MPAATVQQLVPPSLSSTLTKMTTAREICSNPFRIPRHNSTNGLRNVPDLVRERLAHVSFGRRICVECRKRVHTLLKQRHQVKPSTRLSGQQPEILPLPRTPIQSRSSGINGNATSPIVNGGSSRQSSGTTTNVNRQTQPVVQSTTSTPVQVQEQKQEEEGRRRSVPTTSAGDVPNLTTDSSSTVLEPTMSRRNHSNNRLQVQPQQQQRQQQQQQLQQALVTNIPSGKRICCFCGLMEDNELEFGKFYHHKGIVTHYYCLLLSSNMEQKGNDDEGILGFLADDISKEIKRGKRLVCSYCKKNGATLGCCNVRCKKIFHFPCGLKAGSLHQFFGEFRSYCISHRPRQRIDDKVKREIQSMTNILCYICYEAVEPLDNNGTMWAPCCKKNAWFHRKCVQQLAMSAGYFFKCPLCNNKREFQTAMLEYGIYIPRQDASWELVPNAFEELLYRHDRCDAKSCLCPKGRNHTSNNAKWELALCRLCGSQGVHIFCGRLKWANPVWECQECITITRKSNQNTIATDDSTSNSNESIRREESSLLNITIREYDEDSDSDISVGNELVPHIENSLDSIPTIIPQVKLRPGPRSFKLQQVEKLKNSETNKTSTNPTSHSHSSNGTIRDSRSFSQTSNISASSSSASKMEPMDVICLDSDDEAVEIVCESTMRSRSNRSTQFSNSNEASKSISSNFSRTITQNTLTIPSNNYNQVNLVPLSPLVKVAPPPATDDNEDSPFNIIISNVTSVPPEFFASVPEPPEERSPITTLVQESVMDVDSTAPLKRTLPCDEENDCQIVVETPKRARLDGVASYIGPLVTSVAEASGKAIAKLDAIDSTQSLPGATKQIPNDAVTTVAFAGCSAESSSLDNSHSWGSNSVTGMQAPILPQSLTPAGIPVLMIAAPQTMVEQQPQQQQQQRQQQQQQQQQQPESYPTLEQLIRTQVMDVVPSMKLVPFSDIQLPIAAAAAAMAAAPSQEVPLVIDLD